MRSASSEQAFVLRAIGGPPAAGRDPGLEDLARAVDWTRLLQSAPRGVHPYLARCLESRLPASAVPLEVREELGRIERAAAGRYLQRHAELGRVLAALRRAGTPVIVLKGMALAHTVYPDPSQRAMLDIDLLVPGERWDTARSALLEAGLRVPPRWEARPRTGPNSREERDRPFERPGSGVLVELHADLESCRPPFSFQESRIWERASAFRLGGLDALVLHPEDALVHVGLHLSSAHRFQHGLRALLDVHLQVERSAAGLDWPRLAQDCRAAGAGAWMHLTLRLARDLLGSPVPESFLDALPAPDALEELALLAREQLWHAESVGVPPGLVSLRAEPPKARLGRLLGRLNPWRRGEGLAAAARRLLSDLVTRGPLYTAAWKRGDLSGAPLARAVALLRGRERIGELMEGSVNASPPPVPASGSAAPPNPRTPGAGAG
jgi:hypothetical protein